MTPAEKTIQRESIVLRVLWMVLFLVVWQVAVPLLGIVVVAQLLYRLFYGAPSAHFMRFGDSLSQYLAQIGRFAVFNTDAKPWPVADWPQAHAADGEAAHVPKNKQAAETVENQAETEVAETEQTPDPKAASDASDAPEVPEVPEVPDAPEAAEAPELTEESAASEKTPAAAESAVDEQSAALDEQTETGTKP